MCCCPTQPENALVFLCERPLQEPEELLVPDDNEFTEIMELGRCALLTVSPDPVLMKELRNLGAGDE